nr:PREDICTED: F-box/kelch-repeat protein At3g23880-like [Nicotiana sylvestris]
MAGPYIYIYILTKLEEFCSKIKFVRLKWTLKPLLEQSSPSLPQDLIIEILVRLPVKSLLQLKCVSKDWLSLISSHEFVNTHLSFNSKDCTRHRLMLQFMTYLKHCSVSLLFSGFSTDSFDLDIPTKTPDDRFDVVGSVNGLICLSIGFKCLVLWNPSTRKFRHVPDIMNMLALDFVCQYMYGFGYDEVNDDYKVVAVFSELTCACVSIYSLKNDSWRRLDDIQGLVAYNRWPKLVSRKLHWVNVGEGRTIMSIDLVDEKYGKVEQPLYEEGQKFLKLGVLGNDFSVLCHYYLIRADVWVMKEYGVKESGIKLYTFKYHNAPEPAAFPTHLHVK